MNMSYGFLDIVEDLIESLIVSAEAVADLLCPFCNRGTVHRVFRENPDGSYDEVALKCKKCDRNLY
jgi:hypothetical protein